MKQSQSTLNSIIEDTSIPPLICPFCQINIPKIQLCPSSGKIDLKVTCPCSESQTTSLRDFITRITERNVRKCKHHFLTAAKYCVQCSSWLCPSCEFDFYSYCPQCQQNLCEECDTHPTHEVIRLRLNGTNDFELETIDKLIKTNEINTNEVIDMISTEIMQLTKMKRELKRIYKLNKGINSDLRQLYVSLFRTSYLFMHLPSYNLMKLREQFIINEEREYDNHQFSPVINIFEEFELLKGNLLKQYILRDKLPIYCCETISVRPFSTCLIQISNGQLYSGHKNQIISSKDGKTEVKLDRHILQVTCLAELDNQRLASGSSDKTVKLWSTTTNKCLATLRGHTDEVKSLTSLSHNRLASCSEDKTIRIWSTLTNECIMTITGHWQLVNCVIELTNGQLAYGSEDATIKLLARITNKKTATLNEHNQGVLSLIQLTDGRLASGSRDHKIKLWNALTCECIRTIMPCIGIIQCLVELPDGRLVSGSGNGTLQIRNTRTSEKFTLMKGGNMPIKSIFNRRKNKLGVFYSNTLQFWIVEGG